MKTVNFIVLSMLLAACSTMSDVEKVSKRAELDAMAQAAIAGLVKQDETLQQEIDDALGYAVANMKVTKVPVVGAGGLPLQIIQNKAP